MNVEYKFEMFEHLPIKGFPRFVEPLAFAPTREKKLPILNPQVLKDTSSKDMR